MEQEEEEEEEEESGTERKSEREAETLGRFTRTVREEGECASPLVKACAGMCAHRAPIPTLQSQP